MAMQLDDKAALIEPAAETSEASAAWWHRFADIYETESGPSRIVPMEGVRGWAVLLVFFVHFHGAFSKYVSPGSPLFHISEFLGTLGATGVDLFFVISGYLIYGAVIRSKFNYRRFMRRRVQRIYPTFLFLFFIYIGLWLFSSDENFKFHGTIGQKAAYIAQNLLLMPGIFRVRAMIIVTWSLSYEMFFYLVLPLVVAVTGMRRSSRAFRVSFFLALIAVGVLISPLWVHPRVRLIGFLFGIVLFEVEEGFRARSSNIRKPSGSGGVFVRLRTDLRPRHDQPYTRFICASLDLPDRRRDVVCVLRFLFPWRRSPESRVELAAAACAGEHELLVLSDSRTGDWRGQAGRSPTYPAGRS